MKRLIAILVLICPIMAYSADGDLISSCYFNENLSDTTATQAATSCGYTPTFTARAVLTTNGGHDGGRCLTFSHPGTSMEVYDPFDTPAFGKTSITYEWWERYSRPTTDHNYWNTKGARVYVTGLNSPNPGGTVSRYADGGIYFGGYGPYATFVINPDAVSYMANCDWGSAYNSLISGNTYQGPCSGSEANGKTYIRITPASGTTWHKYRQYVKPPTSYAAQDGVMMLWRDDVLLITETNMRHLSYPDNPTIANIRFNPVMGFQTTPYLAFDMEFDDIRVWEGYVPPGTSSGSLRSGSGNFTIQ